MYFRRNNRNRKNLRPKINHQYKKYGGSNSVSDFDYYNSQNRYNMEEIQNYNQRQSTNYQTTFQYQGSFSDPRYRSNNNNVQKKNYWKRKNKRYASNFRKISFMDGRGYLRWKDTGNLIHRTVAWKHGKCNPNPNKKFGECDVHHIDGNKLNIHLRIMKF